MLRMTSIMAAAVLMTGCATGMYDAPTGEDVAKLRVDNQLSAGSQGNSGGWQMPGQAMPTRAAIFKVDGDRVAEQAGAQEVAVEPGVRAIEVFADQSGILRFGTFHFDFTESGKYQVRINSSEGVADYQLELINMAAPDHVVMSKDF